MVASTVFFGFLILAIWKISTMVYDRREFAKFIRAQAIESRVKRFSFHVYALIVTVWPGSIIHVTILSI